MATAPVIVSGTLSATGGSAAVQGFKPLGAFTLYLDFDTSDAVGTATLQVKRTGDLVFRDCVGRSWTTGPVDIIVEEPEEDAEYQVLFTRTSGGLAYRMGAPGGPKWGLTGAGGEPGIGNTTDTAATDDTGSWSLISLTKRLLQKLTAGIIAICTRAVTPGDWNYVALNGGISVTTPVQLVATGGVAVYRTLDAWDVMNKHATVGTDVIILSGTTEIWRQWFPPQTALVTPTLPREFGEGKPLAGASNEALNVQLSAAGTVYFNARGSTVQ